MEFITGNWLFWLVLFLGSGFYMALGTFAVGADILFSGGKMSSFGGQVPHFKKALGVFMASSVPLIITIANLFI